MADSVAPIICNDTKIQRQQGSGELDIIHFEKSLKISIKHSVRFMKVWFNGADL